MLQPVNAPIRVLIVHGDDAYRRKVCAWLASANGITVVGETEDARQAPILAQEFKPDAVLLDAHTIQGSAGQAVAQLRAAAPGMGIIVLHGEGQEEVVLAALRAGALGHLAKDSMGGSDIAAALRLVSRGKAVLSPGVAGHILDELIQERRRRG